MSLANRESPSGYIPTLDGWRAVAILLVMISHALHSYARDLPAESWLDHVSTGTHGVNLFFGISGLLITSRLVDEWNRHGRISLRGFYVRRVFRILPAALLVLVCVGALGMAGLLPVARSELVASLFFYRNYLPALLAPDGTGFFTAHYWSLAVEEHFYLVWPLLVFALSRRGIVRACLAGIVSALALRIVLTVAGVDELSISVLTPCRLDSLCVGGLLAALCRGEQGAEPVVARANALALASGSAILAVSLWCVATHSGVAVLKTIRGSLFAVFFGALALISISPGASAMARLFRTRILRFFGKYSYGLYVYHGLATWYLLERGVRERIDALVGNHSLAIVATAALGSAASLLVAIASYELFEKRFLSLKRFFEAAEPAPEAAAAREAQRVSVA
jgi:peptidoglycan/LPS O-acetylase OafA/YrhL